jgi:hypothetical protein
MALAGTTFIVVKAMFADKLEILKGEMNVLKVNNNNSLSLYLLSVHHRAN